MALHGVEENELVKLSNMKFLHERVKKADRILSY